MENKIVLTKVSDARYSKNSTNNIATYITNNGLEVVIPYNNNGKDGIEVEGKAFIKILNK